MPQRCLPGRASTFPSLSALLLPGRTSLPQQPPKSSKATSRARRTPSLSANERSRPAARCLRQGLPRRLTDGGRECAAGPRRPIDHSLAGVTFPLRHPSATSGLQCLARRVARTSAPKSRKLPWLMRAAGASARHSSARTDSDAACRGRVRDRTRAPTRWRDSLSGQMKEQRWSTGKFRIRNKKILRQTNNNKDKRNTVISK